MKVKQGVRLPVAVPPTFLDAHAALVVRLWQRAMNAVDMCDVEYLKRIGPVQYAHEQGVLPTFPYEGQMKAFTDKCHDVQRWMRDAGKIDEHRE